MEFEDKTVNSEQIKHKEHRHHHHHHRHHHSRNKGKIAMFFDRYSKIIKAVLLIALCVAVGLAVALIGQRYIIPKEGENAQKENNYQQTEFPEESIDNSDGFIYIGVRSIDSEVLTVSEEIRMYVKADIGVTPMNIAGNDEKDIRHDVGFPVSLVFGMDKLPNGISVVKAEVEISEDANFRNSRTVLVNENYTADIYNLKTGTTYNYRAYFTFSDNSKVSVGGTFATEKSPRIMNIEGVYNMRDIGGWEGENGKIVKQGLLYRGAEIDGAVEPKYKLTNKGYADMVGVLGIRTDMDLRNIDDVGEGAYILGANVEHRYYNIPDYAELFNIENSDEVREIFSDLAKVEKYPIYLHDTYGVDKTGSICYILEALLGMSENSLIKEYELSAFHNLKTDRNNIRTVAEGLKTYGGISMQENAENYLLSIGVTEEEISDIKEIFLGN